MFVTIWSIHAQYHLINRFDDSEELMRFLYQQEIEYKPVHTVAVQLNGRALLEAWVNKQGGEIKEKYDAVQKYWEDAEA